MTKQLLVYAASSLAVLLLLSGCGPREESTAVASMETGPVSAQAFLLDEVPEGVAGLNDGLAGAAPGEVVLVTGRIGGTIEPLSENFAGFVLADEVIEFCDEMSKEDHCATPWDACCEDPDKIAASRAFVQFVDADGIPLQLSLGHTIGLKANDQVIVQGYLSPDSTPDNRIIIARGIAIRG